MVVIMKREFTPEQLEAAVHTMEEGGVKVMVSKGAETTILGAEGNAEHIDQEKLSLRGLCRDLFSILNSRCI